MSDTSIAEFREKIQRLVKKRHQREKENALIVAVCDKAEALTADNDRLKARVAELERDNAILRAEQSGAVYVCPECDIAGCKHVRAALKNKDRPNDG